MPISSIWLEIGILTDFEVLINGEMDLKLHLYSLTLVWVKSSPMEKYSLVGLEESRSVIQTRAKEISNSFDVY